LKAFLLYILCLALALILLPAMLVENWWKWDIEAEARVESIEPVPQALEEKFILKIYLANAGESKEMELEEYVAGVVTAEMPASFNLEALKAQAVITRTYTLQKALSLGGEGCRNHPEADLCTDAACCQGWENDRQALEKWPSAGATAYLEKIREAVGSTGGLVLTYGGNLIPAVYHSTCGGMTEDAENVWSGGGTFYLQGVECNYCRHSPHYRQEIVMDLASFVAALKTEREAIPVVAEGNVPLMEVVQRSKSGRNLLLNIGKPGQKYRGTDVRNLLGLPSTFFQWRTEGDKIIFSTRGYGHGVGMCQYGADGMAGEGKDFIAILKHYYPGTEVEHFPLSGWQDIDSSAQGPEAPGQAAVTTPDMVNAPDF
jgi:stage II sporulation protein D